METSLERIEKKLAELEATLAAVHQSSEQMRKYFLWTLIVTVAVIVLPLLAFPFVIPAFLQSVAF
ncbi:MAG: hypothetical protein A2664_02345 [Candidatus Taylorbacteria bacterium RIFCSPHIGHO2_01_FULL_46_22b]|uniref:Uncharacterized protein n=1 Tax=Candidatus Taylorbacteria bacterium RIFCSPHIGHO2_01_FULL_46_22b TaxID=1802301 RepID=A0A1G2M593_9BACT|nr:MAG: hypothetical protein A2664_02345 [Candidatus Taylorbacteria bacterium RIFCSPHIGHO2_01_FULL_46_22b]